MKKIIAVFIAAAAVVCGVYVWRAHRLSDMVGQMILVGFRGTDSSDASVRDLTDDIRAGKIGGVILFNYDVELQSPIRNIIDVHQVKKLNQYLADAARDAGRPPLLVSIDQEGGNVARLKPEHGFDVVLPTARAMSDMSGDKIFSMYERLGAGLRDLGFNLNFAPDTDTDINPNSPAIGAKGRAFSNDANRVAEYGKVAAAGLYAGGVLSSYKHFPGHGSAGADTHIGLVDITDIWDAAELTPYQAVPEHTLVMVAHVVNNHIDADTPASLSAATINGLLRGQLGYNGVVITDDLQMGAIYNAYGFKETLRRAVLAGNDILLLGNNLQYTENIGRIAHREIMGMVRRGEIPRSRIRESYKRILRMKGLVNNE